jgi:secondary thiamine-phosphate synthase enzyme
MRQFQRELSVATGGRGFVDVTARVQSAVRDSGIQTGLCTLFLRHTSASLVIQENSDPAVLRDLYKWLDSLAPESRPWEHDAEGPDDMPAHAKAALTHSNENLPIQAGKLVLGTWQAIYLCEHRSRGHDRKLFVHVFGD